MKVNLAAFSILHFRDFAGILANAGVLNRFYYSHRISTDWRQLGLTRVQAVNAFLPAYLAGAHMRWLPPTDSSACYDRYSALWQDMMLRRWSPAPILHALIGYRVEKLMHRAKRDGAMVLAQLATPFWGRQLEIERQEWAYLGLDERDRCWTMTPEQESHYRLADRFLVHSCFARDTLIEAGVKPHRIDVVPPPSGFPPTAPALPSSGPFRVVVAGRLDPIKGHRYLLEAWRRLRLPDAELIFVGGATAATPRILAGYDGLYRHIPHTSLDNVAALMRQASVVVLPSVCDAWGQTVVEALACGVPVIVTRNVGAADCVEDGVSGFVVPARDPDALAIALERLYREPDLRRAMVARVSAPLDAIGDWDRYASRLLTIYSTLVSGNAP